MVGILNKMASQLGDGIAVSSTPAPIPGLGSAAGFSGYLQSRENDDPLVLQQVAELFISELQKSSILTSLRTTAKAESPMLMVNVDEAKALALGVPIEDIYSTLAAFLGGTYINDFTRNGKINRVIMQADSQYRMSPEHLGRAWVKAQSGDCLLYTSPSPRDS